MMLILWNIYNFFVSYANVDNYQISSTKYKLTHNILDKWIVSLLHLLIREVTDNLEKYDTISAIANVQRFINDFSTWYIRRSRDRVGPSAKDTHDKKNFYDTCYEVLVVLSKLIAPITPFISEEIYKSLTTKESVHLSDWPAEDGSLIDKDLICNMQSLRTLIIEQAHALRKNHSIKVRQPLNRIVILDNPSGDYKKTYQPFENLIKDELNLKNVDYRLVNDLTDEEKGSDTNKGSFYLDIKITPELKAEGE